MKDCKKVLFVLTTLGGGGAEKVLINILKYLDRNKFDPYLVLLKKEGEYLEEVPADVLIYDLNKKSRFDFFKIIFLLAFKIYPKIRPDIVISYLVYTNLVVLFARKISLIKPSIILSERNFPSKHSKKTLISAFKRMLIKKTYANSERIIALSKGVAVELEKTFKIPKQIIQVIYNGIDLSFIRSEAKEPIGDIPGIKDSIPILVSCARLTYQKNYPLLLETFALVQKQIDSKLLILGQGEERSVLEKLVDRLGINGKVSFLGFQKNPYKYMAAADIFILSSLWEGFGNVVVEAMACGTPVISTRCGGPEEIISDGLNGVLVPLQNPDAFADAIIGLLKNKKLAEQFIRNGYKRVEDFRVKKMVKQYEKVIDGVLSSKQSSKFK